MNETLISYSTLLMLFYTDWVPLEEFKIQIGWVMCLMVSLMFIINLSILFKKMKRAFELISRKLYNRLRKKKSSKEKKYVEPKQEKEEAKIADDAE